MVVVFVLQPAAGLYFKKFFLSLIKVGTLVSQYFTESIFFKLIFRTKDFSGALGRLNILNVG